MSFLAPISLMIAASDVAVLAKTRRRDCGERNDARPKARARPLKAVRQTQSPNLIKRPHREFIPSRPALSRPCDGNAGERILTPQERNARAYCLSIGANPDDLVKGVNKERYGTAERLTAPRWCWYVGAKIQQQHAAE